MVDTTVAKGRFSDYVDGGDVESGIMVDTTVTDGKRKDDSGDEGSRESGMGTARSHAENEIFGNPYLGRLSLAQGVRLKGTGGRASDRHSRSESIARLDRRTDGGTERGLPWPFSRFLTHPLPKSLSFRPSRDLALFSTNLQQDSVFHDSSCPR